MVQVNTTNNPFQPGFRLFDGSQMNAVQAADVTSAADGIVASTVQTRLGGTDIVQQYNRVSAANASDAVTLCGQPGTQGSILPQAGMSFVVKNVGGQTIQVFPPGPSDTIDGGAAGAAVNLGNAKTGLYYCTAVIGSVATWNSASMAVST